MTFNQGEMVGPYRIIEQLGRGGMATVFKAYHANLDRYVAIKVLHPAFLEDDAFLTRFEREAKVVAKLEHPNITPIYDFAEHNGSPYLVMKYVEGETLKARLKQGPLSPEEGVRVIQAVGDALSYAHDRDILHRDVKPSNVILADDGQIFLTDFGLARIASAGETTISNDMMIGTPQYISPEQAMGKRDLDAGTDIYSFGVLIYELVVGRVPFSADTPFAIIHDHIYTPLPLPRMINPNVPEVIERLLLKALTKERSDRFDNIDEMVGAFRKAIQGQTLPDMWVSPESHTPTPTPPPFQSTVVEADTPAPADPDLPQVDNQVKVEKPKRGWRWWYGIPVGMVLCACLLVVIGIIRNQSENLAANANEINRPGNQSINEPGEDLDFLDQAIQNALEEVENDFENPYAHLGLAELLLDSGDIDGAEEHLRIGAEFAGDDWDYHLKAGDILFERQLWLPALMQYRSVIKNEDFTPDRNFSNQLQAAIYLSAQNPNAEQILFGTDGVNLPRQVEPVVLSAAKVRFELYAHDNPEAAQQALDNALKRFTDNPILNLTQAEILWKTGGTAEAEQIFEELKSNALDWIRDLTAIVITQLP